MRVRSDFLVRRGESGRHCRTLRGAGLSKTPRRTFVDLPERVTLGKKNVYVFKWTPNPVRNKSRVWRGLKFLIQSYSDNKLETLDLSPNVQLFLLAAWGVRAGRCRTRSTPAQAHFLGELSNDKASHKSAVTP